MDEMIIVGRNWSRDLEPDCIHKGCTKDYCITEGYVCAFYETTYPSQFESKNFKIQIRVVNEK